MENDQPENNLNYHSPAEAKQNPPAKQTGPLLSAEKAKEFITPKLLTLEQPHLLGKYKKAQSAQPSAQKSFFLALLTITATIIIGIAIAFFLRQSLQREKSEDLSLPAQPPAVPTAIPKLPNSPQATQSGFNFRQIPFPFPMLPTASPSTQSAPNQTTQAD